MIDSPLFDVITIGSSTIDAFCKTDAELITMQDSKEKKELIAYPVGSKILINNLQFMIGGGGTNTAVSFSRLGLNTAYLGTLGDDSNSEMILDMLNREKITFIGTKKKNTPSGYSVVLDSIKEDRTILTYKGSNDLFLFSEIDKKIFSSSWLYLCAMTGKALSELDKVCLHASKKGIKIAFNPSSYIAKFGISKLKIMKYVDVLIINREELNQLLSLEESSLITLEKLKKILKYGPKIVVVTDGSKEVHAHDGKNHYTLLPSKVKVVETTGAGDAFASSFISGLIMNKNISESLKMGIINSQSVIANYGAKNILLSRKEIEKKLKSSKLKVNFL